MQRLMMMNKRGVKLSTIHSTMIRRHYSTTNNQHVENASKHIRRILDTSMQFDTSKQKLVLIHDTWSDLSKILSEAYRQQQENLIEIDFDQHKANDIKEVINTQLTPGDLVVLVQTSAFYLNEYRIRLDLFDRNLKTIEHVHLGLMSPEQYSTYIDTLAFDHTKTGALARSLKNIMDTSKQFVVESGEGHRLEYNTGMEPAKLNLGDYSEMKNVGGTFPVGEVFSEPTDLSSINGQVSCFGFPNLDRIVEIHNEKPFTLNITNGIVTSISDDAPDTFKQVYELIKSSEGEVMIREFGVGLNEGTGKDHPLNDVTAFERQKGLHFSLGKKHTVYKKAGLKAKRTRFHIDVFVDVRKIYMDDNLVFDNGNFLMNQ
jgi:aminopeptidase